MMKRSFLYVCAGALALAACTNDEVIAPVENSGIAIGFGTVTGPAASRGAVTTANILQDNTSHEFLVTAYQHGNTAWDTYALSNIPEITTTSDNFVMLNQKVAWDNNVWKYDPPKYWPGKVDGTSYGKVTFFGIGRKKGDTTFTFNTTTKKPEYIYTTPAVASEQDDLVANTQFDQKYESDQTKVTFQFGHILSKIGFKAKLQNSYANTTVKVTKLIVGYNNVVKKGTYAFNTKSTTANDGWTLSTNDKFSPSDTSGDIIKAGGVTVNSIDVNNLDVLNADDKFLMLIPQPIGNDDLIISFTYVIVGIL